MSGGVVGAAERRFGSRIASLLLLTPIVLGVALMDALVAAAAAARRTFADDFATLRNRRKQLRRATPEHLGGEGG